MAGPCGKAPATVAGRNRSGGNERRERGSHCTAVQRWPAAPGPRPCSCAGQLLGPRVERAVAPQRTVGASSASPQR
eukprot:15481199-Alexandrium_andersonii.AAC.1